MNKLKFRYCNDELIVYMNMILYYKFVNEILIGYYVYIISLMYFVEFMFFVKYIFFSMFIIIV